MGSKWPYIRGKNAFRIYLLVISRLVNEDHYLRMVLIASFLFLCKLTRIFAETKLWSEDTPW